MTYQLVAIDVDGTLENPDHIITPRTAQALEAAQAAGVHIVLATGKMYIGITAYVERFGLNSPQITSGGAVITQNGQTIYQQRIPRLLAERVIHLAQELGVTLVLLRDDQTFAAAINRDTDYMETYGDPHPIVVPNLLDALDPPPTQIYAIPYLQDALFSGSWKLFQHALGDYLGIRKSSPYYIEFVHPAVSKGAALQQLSTMLDIQPDAMLAIGDSYNDLSMFEYAGYAVAMGHSAAEVQAAADWVTQSNAEDGVALALERLILNKL